MADLALRLRIDGEGAGAVRMVDELGNAGQRAGQKLNSAFTGSVTGSASLRAEVDKLKSSIVAVAAVAGTIKIGSDFARQVIDASNATIGWKAGMQAIAGSTAAATAELAFARNEAGRLGTDLRAGTDSWISFAAATRGSALEGAGARNVYTAISEAMRVLNRDTEQTRGALTAIEQMVSKGTVSAEELRGQLGERLPGAFRLAAEAMGVTSAELGKLLERGEVAAEDLLPKLANKLRELYSGAAVDAATSPAAEMARLRNEIFETSAAIGDAGFMDALAAGARALTAGLSTVRESGALEYLVDFGGLLLTGAVLVGLSKAGGALVAFGQGLVEQAAKTRLAAAAESAYRDMIAATDAARVRSIALQREELAVSAAAAAAEVNRARLEVLRASRMQAAAAAAGTQSFALKILAEAETRLAFAMAARDAATTSLTAKTAALTAAQGAAAAAGTAAAASSAAATVAAGSGIAALGVRLLAFLGGPWGLLIAGLTAAPLLWSAFGDSVDDVGAKVESATERLRRMADESDRLAVSSQSTTQVMAAAYAEREKLTDQLSAAQERLNTLLSQPQTLESAGLAIGRAGEEVELFKSKLAETELQIGRTLVQQNAWMNAAVTGFASAIENGTIFESTVNGIKAAYDALVGRVATADFGAQIAEQTKTIEAAIKSATQSLQVAQGKNPLVEQFKELAENMRAAGQEVPASLQALVDKFESLDKQLKVTKGSASAHRTELKDLAKDQRDAAASIKSANDLIAASYRAAYSELDPAAAKLSAYGEEIGKLTDLIGKAGVDQAKLAAAIELVTEARDQHQRVMDAAIDSGDAIIERLKQEIADVGRTGAEYLALREIREENNRRVQAGQAVLTAAQEAEITGLHRIKEATEQTADAARAAADAAQQSAENWRNYWGSALASVSDAFGEWAASGGKDGEKLRDSLKRTWNQIKADLLSTLFKQQFVIPIVAQLVGGSGLGGGLSSLLGGLTGGGGANAGLMQALGLGGGATPGGGILGSLSGGLGSVFGNLSSTLSGGFGGILSNIGGFFSQGAAFQSGILGALGNFGGGLATAGANIAGGFFSSIGPNLAQGAASLFSGSIAAGLGQLIPVIGQIAMVATALDAVTGGRIFGRGFKATGTTSSLSIGATGGSASASVQEHRRGSLFGGSTKDRDRIVDAGDEARQAAQQLYDGFKQVLIDASRQLASEAPAMISASIRTVVELDKKGKETSRKIMVDAIGRSWEEASMEAASNRITAEVLIAAIDNAFGGVAPATGAMIAAEAEAAFAAGAEGLGAAAGRGFESATNAVLKGAQSTQGEASAIAERWRTDSSKLLDGAQFLFAAAVDIRRGSALLTDGSLTDVANLIERLASDGESLTAAYQRVVASVALMDQALGLSGIELDKTREQLIEFSAGVVEALGGLDRAQAMWTSYFNNFYTEQERGIYALGQARTSATSALSGLGLDPAALFGEGGMAAYREAFEAGLPTFTPAQVAQWLEAGDALARFTALSNQFAGAAALGSESLSEFMATIIGGLAAPDLSLADQLDAQRAQNDELIARAAELGASEEQLAQVRLFGQQQIDAIIASVGGQVSATRSMLELLGTTAVGTTEQFAVAISGLSEGFSDRLQDFFETAYDVTEQAGMQLAQANSQLNASLIAAGLSTVDLITKTQLRAQIEAALASGNYTLADSLLAVWAAMGRVDEATRRTTAALNEQASTGRGPNMFFGSGGGFGDAGGPGGAGGSNPVDDLTDQIARLRDGLREWLVSLTTGDLNPARPRERLRLAQAEYDRLLALAQAGDVDALRQIQGAAQNVLRLGRTVYGSTSGYNAIYDQIIAQIGGLAGGVPGGGGGGDVGGGVGDLGRAAINAALALDQMSARLGLQAGSLSAGLNLQITQLVPGMLESFATATNNPLKGGGVVSRPPVDVRPSPAPIDVSPIADVLARGRREQADEAKLLRDEVAAMRAAMEIMRRSQELATDAVDRQTDVIRRGR